MSQSIVRPSASSAPMKVVWATLVREWWVNLRAYRMSFFAAVLLNSLFTLLIGYFLFRVVFSGHVTRQFVTYTGMHDYLSYLTLGVVTYNFTYRLLYPVRNLLFERWEGTLQPLLLAGVPLVWYQVGCIAFSAIYSVVESGILLAIVWPFAGLDLAQANLLGFLLAAIGTVWGLLGVSMLLSAINLWAFDRAVVEGIALTLMQLVGGVLFPVLYLPVPLQWLARAIPLSWALQALRETTLQGASPAQIAPDLLMLLLLGAVYMVLGKWLLGRTIARALESGE